MAWGMHDGIAELIVLCRLTGLFFWEGKFGFCTDPDRAGTGGGGPREGIETDWILCIDSTNCGAFTFGGSLGGGDVDEEVEAFRAGILGKFCVGWIASILMGIGCMT